MIKIYILSSFLKLSRRISQKTLCNLVVQFLEIVLQKKEKMLSKHLGRVFRVLLGMSFLAP